MKSELPVIKNCNTCAHRRGINFEYAKCMKSGYYCIIERRYLDVCDINFSAWEQRPSLIQRLINIFKWR